MSVLYILILISLIVAGGFLIIFFWAIKDGQFEDEFSPPVRILNDDKPQTDLKQK